MESRPTPILAVMRQRLRALTETARLHQQATDRIRAGLPDEVAAHCRGAVVAGDTLTLYVDAPAWATRLRFLAPSLLRQLAATDPQVRHCLIRVLPPGELPRSARLPERPARVSESASLTVHSAAAATDSPGLAAALRRLARTLAGRR